MTNQESWRANPGDPTRWAALPPPGPAWSGAPPPPAGWGSPPPTPPSWGPPGPPKRDRGPLWAVLAVICVIAVAAIVVVLVLTGRHTDSAAVGSAPQTSAQETAPVPASVIDRLLPDKETLTSAVADPELRMEVDENRMDEENIVGADCQGLASTAAGAVYAGSGWTAVHWQRWRSPAEPDPDAVHDVLVTVVTYPRKSAADDFRAALSRIWNDCAGRSINVRPTADTGKPDDFWSAGQVSEAGDVLIVPVTQEGGNGWLCQNGLSVRNNVIIRTDVCGYPDTIPDNATVTLVDAVTEKIDAAA